MAIYSFHNESFQKVEKTTFSSEGILERKHLQVALKQQIDVIAPDCIVISEEFSEWSDSKHKIDLLAIDKKGNLVVIELKRTETGDYMELQALRYAAMVSTLTFSRATEIYQKYLKAIDNEVNAKDKLLEFLGWEEPQEEDFALDVRIVLVSANFSKEVTTSVMWLNERNLDITCVRLIPYKYQDQILVDVQQIIPLPEVESYQVKIKQQSEERREARKSSKDHTRYLLQGNSFSFSKRKLVLSVIQHWFTEKKPNNLSELLQAFPQTIKSKSESGRLFVPFQEAKEIYNKQEKSNPRHFLGDEEVLEFPDSTQFAVSNQWDKETVEKFISQAKKLGYEIEEEFEETS
jgi:hypothetical protein